MKIFGIGMNYALHTKELGNKLPTSPVVFMKPDTSLLKDNLPFFYPDFSNNIHHEVEIVVKIEKEGKNIDSKFAHKYYSQIALGIDFTARDLQEKLRSDGHPWLLCKGFDRAAPVSNFIDIDNLDTNNIEFNLSINNTIKQSGNTKDMIFNIDSIISYISGFCTLKKGDLIFTGTPEGVGEVKVGDRLQGYIQNEKLLDFEVL